MGSIDRNSLCPCGSGQKYKKCCMGSADPVVAKAPVPEAFQWEKPSRGREQDEQIDLFMIQGFGSRNKGDLPAALEIWARAWDQLLLRLSPSMTSFEASLPAYDGSFFLKNWAQDYCAILNTVAYKDVLMAKTGASFCEGILLQFTSEDSRFLSSFRASLGEFLFLAGETQEGENHLVELIKDQPHAAIGYAYLADVFGQPQYNSQADAPLDLDRAIDLLETALAFPVQDAADYDLEKRLVEFRSIKN